MRIILLSVLAFCFCFFAVGCGGYQPLSSIEPISSSLWAELQADEEDRVMVILPSDSPIAEQ